MQGRPNSNPHNDPKQFLTQGWRFRSMVRFRNITHAAAFLACAGMLVPRAVARLPNDRPNPPQFPT